MKQKTQTSADALNTVVEIENVLVNITQDLNASELDLEMALFQTTEASESEKAELKKSILKIKKEIAANTDLKSDQEKLLKFAKEKFQRIKAAEDAAAIEAQWKEVEFLAEQRLEVAKSLPEEIKKIFEKMQKLRDLAAEMHLKAPVSDQFGGSPLSHERTEGAVRMLMRLSGFDWAFSKHWNDDMPPNFVGMIDDSNKWGLKYRTKI